MPVGSAIQLTAGMLQNVNLKPERFFGPPAIVNVEINSDPVQQDSVGGPNRLGATEEPQVPSFGVPHTNTQVPGRARS
jgi:hypothetical protein